MLDSRLRAALTLALLAAPAYADDALVTYTTGSTSAPLPYVEYLPPGYTAGTGLERLVLFFHGVGESGAGTDATALYNAMTSNGPLQLIRAAGSGPHRFQSSHRAVVLAPRNPSGLWSAALASQFFQWARTHYRLDSDRLYVTGLSAGGGPTWTVPVDNPGAVAAVVPICPVQQLWPVTDASAAEYRQVAVWAFHGFGDPTVPRQESINWMNAIGRAVSRDAGFPDVMTGYPHANGQPSASAGVDETAAWTSGGYAWSAGVSASSASPIHFTLLDRNDHFIWGTVYDTGAVWDWLFAQRRSANVDPGLPDAGGVLPVDAGRPDAGTGDAGTGDSGVGDAGAGDAGTGDAGAGDAGDPADSGSTGGPAVDAGSPEAPGSVTASCGCAAAPGTATWLFLAVGLACAARRRRGATAPAGAARRSS